MEAIIYAAKSTEDVHGSIPTQLEDATKFVEREGGNVVASYSDEAASAWSGDRGPHLAEAMAHAERIAPCWLVVQHTDRLARGDGKQSRHLVEIILWGLKHDVRIRSVQDDSTGENLVMAAVMGMRNNEDSTRKSQAVAAGMKRGAEAGNPPGGPRPYGYEYARKKGDLAGPRNELRVVPAQAEVVRRIFREYVAGKTLTGISRELEAESVPTLKGGPWRSSTVSGIIDNPVYVGLVRHGDETFPGRHQGIIEQSVWERANDLRKAKPSKGRGRPTRGPHLFRGGFLRCQCGEAMVPRTKDHGSYELYYCNGRSEFGPEFCSMPSPRRAVIDKAVYEYFAHVGLDHEATRRQIAEERSIKLTEAAALRNQAEREAQLARDRLARVRGHFQDGKLDPEDWREQREQLTDELQAAEAEAKRLSSAEAEIEQSAIAIDADSELIERLSEIRQVIAGEVTDASGADAVRAALTRLFDSFVLHPRIDPQFDLRDKRTGHVELRLNDYIIEPIIRESAVAGYEGEFPVLTRQPLDQAGNNQRIGLPCRYASGPE